MGTSTPVSRFQATRSFDLEVTPEGAAPYAVEHREIVSTMAVGSYPDGSSMACRIDPADPRKVAFGERPFM